MQEVIIVFSRGRTEQQSNRTNDSVAFLVIQLLVLRLKRDGWLFTCDFGWLVSVSQERRAFSYRTAESEFCIVASLDLVRLVYGGFVISATVLMGISRTVNRA